MKFSVNDSSMSGFIFTGAPYVGIGITPERGLPLKVASGKNSYGTSQYQSAYYLTNSTSINRSSTSASWSNISAYFGNHILVAGDILFTSDYRIKKDIKDIDSKSALKLISKIKPKTFKFIDIVEKGDKDNYGFIAQEVKKIVPEAVGLKKDVIPNIFKLFDCKDDIIETNEDLRNQLAINDNIEIIDKENKKTIYKILEISSNHIKIDKKLSEDKCFIFGKEVEDFHILDEDTIFTLNVSATQELNKKIKKYKKIIKKREIKLKEIQEKIDLLLATK
jgi:hypothetical protein